MGDTSTTWPPKEGLGTVAVPRKDAHFVTAAAIRIKAPASLVLEVVQNVGQYSQWNTWVPTVTDIIQPEGVASDTQILHLGTKFTFNVIMDESKPQSITETKLMISDISTPDNESSYVTPEILETDNSWTKDLTKVYRIAWKTHGGFVAMGLMAERFHEIIVISDDECELRNWEAQGGFLARTVKFLYGKTLQKKFQKWNEELKEYCEDKAAQK